MDGTMGKRMLWTGDWLDEKYETGEGLLTLLVKFTTLVTVLFPTIKLTLKLLLPLRFLAYNSARIVEY